MRESSIKDVTFEVLTSFVKDANYTWAQYPDEDPFGPDWIVELRYLEMKPVYDPSPYKYQYVIKNPEWL